MGNFSRNTFDKLKHYVSVRLQQGVPLVDADWNEKEDIRRYELQAFLKRFVGDGVPKGNDGFRIMAIPSNNDFTIRGGDGTTDGAGRILVDGWEAINEGDLRYTAQSSVPALSPPATGTRTDMVYLDIWEREVDSREDTNLVNPAIGIETCVRTKREWVVRVEIGGTTLPRPPDHVFYPLASLRRTAGQPAIQTADITDLRRTGLAVLSKEITITDGKVGIGTTSPSFKLEVVDEVTDRNGLQAFMTNTATTTNSFAAFSAVANGVLAQFFADGLGTGPFGARGGYYGTVTNHPIGLFTNNAEHVRINVNGNVGIGTPSPLTKLHVNGSIMVGIGDTQTFGISSQGGIGALGLLGGTPGLSGQIYLYGDSHASNPGQIHFKAGPTVRMEIMNNGNVGIGRTPTANKLEVEGNASKATAGGWLANSDKRIKKNIQNIENAIEIINQLRPVKFRYADEYRAKHDSIEDKDYYNFIAQEFQKVFPESVQEDAEGFLQIDTGNVTPYLVAAVQELCKKVNELKAENEALIQSSEALEKAAGRKPKK